VETTTTRYNLDVGAYAIDATVHHDGHSHTAGGGFVSDDLVIAYCGKGNTIELWDGSVIGRYVVVSSRPVSSVWSRRRYAIRARVNGAYYHGRTFGEGMIVNLRRCKDA
jgi:hypothetical protein